MAKVAPDSPLAGVFKTNDIIAKVDGQRDRDRRPGGQGPQPLNRPGKALELEIDRVVEGGCSNTSRSELAMTFGIE